MSRSDRYTKDFMPTKEAIQRTYADYTELKELLENSVFHESGYYSLNNGKWFNSAIPSFLYFNIQKPDDEILLSRIYCELSILSKGSRSQQKNDDIDAFWSNHPNSIWGQNKISSTGVFHEGHLIARSLVKYAHTFDYKKWQNFVMLTDWTNSAETFNGDKKAYGMKCFEKIIQESLDEGRDIHYRVTPVFKKNDLEFEPIPRGIILEARIAHSRAKSHRFVGYEGSQFNVFIPNAQGNLIISYKDGKIYNGVVHELKRIYRIKRKSRIFKIKKGRY